MMSPRRRPEYVVSMKAMKRLGYGDSPRSRGKDPIHPLVRAATAALLDSGAIDDASLVTSYAHGDASGQGILDSFAKGKKTDLSSSPPSQVFSALVGHYASSPGKLLDDSTKHKFETVVATKEGKTMACDILVACMDVSPEKRLELSFLLGFLDSITKTENGAGVEDLAKIFAPVLFRAVAAELEALEVATCVLIENWEVVNL